MIVLSGAMRLLQSFMGRVFDSAGLLWDLNKSAENSAKGTSIAQRELTAS